MTNSNRKTKARFASVNYFIWKKGLHSLFKNPSQLILSEETYQFFDTNSIFGSKGTRISTPVAIDILSPYIKLVGHKKFLL